MIEQTRERYERTRHEWGDAEVTDFIDALLSALTREREQHAALVAGLRDAESVARQEALAADIGEDHACIRIADRLDALLREHGGQAREEEKKTDD